MNRTTKFKFLYLTALIVLGGLSFWAYFGSGRNPLVLAGVVVLLLLPGRICGHYWRDFLRGRNLMTQGRIAEAEPLFESFLGKVRARPWIKKLSIFSWGMYTRDIEVMTLNNLGAIKIEQGNFEEGKVLLQQAVSMDALAPLPYFNLALIAAAEKRNVEAGDFLRKAEERGFTGSTTDDLIRQGGELLARIEGR